MPEDKVENLEIWKKENSDYFLNQGSKLYIQSKRIYSANNVLLDFNYFCGPNRETMLRWLGQRVDTSIYPDSTGRFACKETSIHLLSNIYVNTSVSDLISYTNDGHIGLVESTHHDNNSYSWILFRNGVSSIKDYAASIITNSRHIDIGPKKAAILLNTRWSAHNFYHWFHEAIPRLCLLEHTRSKWNDFYLVWGGNYRLREYHIKALSSMGIDQSTINFHSGFTHFSRVLHPTFLHRGGFHPDQLTKMSQIFGSICTRNISYQHEKILILRDSSGARSFGPCDGIDYLINLKGFQAVFLDQYDLSSQISIIKNARIVVAGHGAGLTHIANMKKHTRLIEIMPSNSIHPLYWYLASLRGIFYSTIVSKILDYKQTLYFSKIEIEDHLRGFG
jgi:hypothetical protein